MERNDEKWTKHGYYPFKDFNDFMEKLRNADYGLDCFLLLNGGIRASHNYTIGDDDTIIDMSMVDDSETVWTIDEFKNECLAYEAIEKGCLIGKNVLKEDRLSMS